MDDKKSKIFIKICPPKVNWVHLVSTRRINSSRNNKSVMVKHVRSVKSCVLRIESWNIKSFLNSSFMECAQFFCLDLLTLILTFLVQLTLFCRYTGCITTFLFISFSTQIVNKCKGILPTIYCTYSDVQDKCPIPRRTNGSPIIWCITNS